MYALLFFLFSFLLLFLYMHMCSSYFFICAWCFLCVIHSSLWDSIKLHTVPLKCRFRYTFSVVHIWVWQYSLCICPFCSLCTIECPFVNFLLCLASSLCSRCYMQDYWHWVLLYVYNEFAFKVEDTGKQKNMALLCCHCKLRHILQYCSWGNFRVKKCFCVKCSS